MLTVGSLFAGIGGMDLGLERAGMTVRWQVEIDGYCQKVLAKHWPNVARYSDVREVGAHNLEPVDLICGGFPCQDISNAGKRAGIDGERSGLWAEFARIIRELRPRYVLVENVAALLGRGIDRVLGDLAASGYDAEWDCLSANQFGAPHLRERIFIVAYSRKEPWHIRLLLNKDSEDIGEWWQDPQEWGVNRIITPVGTTTHKRLRVEWRESKMHSSRLHRLDDGIPYILDAIGSLGNAVVPQVAEWIGRRIMEAHANGHD